MPKVTTPDDDLKIPLDQRCTLQELRSHHCRWPVGMPGTEEFFFCGADILEGHVYCNTHCLRAYARFAPPEEANAA